jgi:hypothetical protein
MTETDQEFNPWYFFMIRMYLEFQYNLLQYISDMGEVASSCEHGDEPSGSIKCGKFFD